MQFKASAPGSLMLLGEYAVLHGKQAIVCAVDKRITVTLTPREDEFIHLHASYGDYSTTIHQLKIERPFHFVLGALKYYQTKLRDGCNIEISSDFSDQVGLGSSAAVTVAMLSVLGWWFNMKVPPLDLIRQGRYVIRQVQGVGSGADIATAVYGGVVAYQAQPLYAEKFSIVHPLTVLYSGYKTPTVEAIKFVQERFANHTNIFQYICHSIGQCATEGIQLIRKKEWGRFGDVMNMQQGMMESLGVSMPVLRQMIDYLRQHSDILGAKISGSGLGDSVIGWGALPVSATTIDKTQRILLEMSLQGVHCEKN